MARAMVVTRGLPLSRSLETRVLRPGLLAVLLVVVAATPLRAHDPGLSALDVRIGASQIVATVSLADVDAAPLAPFPIDAIVLAADGIRLNNATQEIGPEPGGGVRVVLSFPRPAGAQLSVTSEVPGRLARGHRQLLSVHNEDGAVLAERMLDAAANTTVVTLAARPSTATTIAGEFFALGIHHIVTGYDHLLFLAAMLLVVGGLREAVAIITAFSAAHAVALVLATIGVLTIPAHVIEPLIAASVVWVGVENLVRPDVGRRWMPAFGFGLVHGLAFAGALSELGAAGSRGSLALRLGFFNAGIEAGQLAFAALALPLLWQARRWPVLASRTRTIGSVAVAVAGVYWLVARLA
jgi:hydrogenase/urease accessory protein HupE